MKKLAGSVVLLWIAFTSVRASAQPIKPRFLVIVDTSGSMSLNPAGTETRGDGSQRHPGIDLDGLNTNGWAYDDSRLFQAKAALMDTFAAFGQAEFALGRYKSLDVSRTCTTDAQCRDASMATLLQSIFADTSGGGVNNFECIDPSHVAGTQGYCAVNRRWGCNNGYPGYPGSNPECYAECLPAPADSTTNFICAPNSYSVTAGGGSTTGSSVRDDWDIYMKGLECSGTSCTYPSCMGADVLVPFPAGSSNFGALVSWLDGQEDYPAGTNRELRANGSTPLASSLGASLNWLTDLASTVGPGAGSRTSDPQASCRPYSVILITDGVENCDVRGGDRAAAGMAAAQALFAQGIRTYIIGFAVPPSERNLLNAMASAGRGQSCTHPYTDCPTSAIIASNRAELTARLGDIIAGSIPAPVCDCNSTCDDENAAFPAKGTVCSVGRGRCKRFGTFHCNGAGNGVSCMVTGSGAAMGLCGGVALTPGTPGTEQCGVLPNCPAGLTPEECADENCDGQIDEGLDCECASRPEVCNGLDDNCNGLTDEIPSIPCGLEIGECRAGMTVCENRGQGFQTYCTNIVGPTDEQCDARDNNCDGVTDGFARACYPAATMGCTFSNGTWTCLGACQTGLQMCPANPSGSTNQFGACVGAVTPRTEIPCDGIDNDCDGQTDEGFGLGNPCYPSGQPGCNLGTGQCIGACRIGSFQCDGGVVRCMNAVAPGEELCGDNIDNNCDGFTDSNLGACGPTLGICSPGQYVCQGNTRVCVQPNGPMPETCNGRDDNCDGVTDNMLIEPIFQTDTACGTNVGICRAGVWRCIAGAPYCLGGIPAATEVCNNLDDDCDGCTDCDMPCLIAINKPMCPVPGSGQTCGFSVGECRPGALLCVAGNTMCVGATNPGVELCDNRDNNCNGFTDEADPLLGTACYPLNTIGCNAGTRECVGECRLGTNICIANRMGGAAIGCTNAITPASELCDGKDNDCDGQTDEGFDVGAVCDNGAAGLCFSVGMRVCNGRGDGTTCSVAPPPISDEICDGIDNDCDGRVDSEDTDRPLPGVGLPCGSNVGECRGGTTLCERGMIRCTAVGPTPELCDGLDNDCDGSVDEDLTPPDSQCVPGNLPANAPIVGQCRAGRFVCARGGNDEWGWQCREGRGPEPELCDGLDNDCDGIADEDAPCPANHSCIAGECVPRCSDGEFECPADRECNEARYCVRARCLGVQCAPGEFCDSTGTCVNRCAGVVCPEGVACTNGLCLNCHFLGCPNGERCGVDTCEPDPCSTGSCPVGSYCRAVDGQATCVRDCLGVTCRTGQSCRDGACVADPCAGVTCPGDAYCDPATGKCQRAICPTLQASCRAGTACVETMQACVRSPCLDVRCASGSDCSVTADGRAICVWPPGTPAPGPRVIDRIASSGGGGTTCECRIGTAPHREREGFAGAWLCFVLSGLGLARWSSRRRRRRAASGGDARPLTTKASDARRRP